MQGETNLSILLKNMKPTLHAGEYVFCTTNNVTHIDEAEILMSFKETEGTTLILKKEIADNHKLQYPFVAAWITLTVHSSLDAVGLTAAFANALAAENISCNVVAAYYHDHIFVNSIDAEKAMLVLKNLPKAWQ